MPSITSSIDNVRLRALVTHARRHSRWYARSLADLPPGWHLADLPLLDTARFWQLDGELCSWAALTSPLRDAYVFRSGGNSGTPRWSICTRGEWTHLCACYGAALATRLAPGERVANLFFSGALHASHLFVHTALSQVDFPISVFPYAGMCDMDALVQSLREQHINVLMGAPSYLMQLGAHLEARSTSLPRVGTILCGGYSMFADQKAMLGRVLPNARIASIGYATADVGLLGASLPDCGDGEHRCFDGETVLEIIDQDSGEPIEDCGRVGLLVATSLSRRLTPLIRCPTGDLACWQESAGTAQRKFILVGHLGSGHQVRVGHARLVPEEIGVNINQILDAPTPWQLLLTREAGIDRVTLRVVRQGVLAPSEKLLANLQATQSGLAELVQAGQAVLDIQWCPPGGLQRDARTGKLQRVVDGRHCGPVT